MYFSCPEVMLKRKTPWQPADSEPNRTWQRFARSWRHVGNKKQISGTGNILQLAPLAVGLDQWSFCWSQITQTHLWPRSWTQSLFVAGQLWSGCMQLLQCNCYIHYYIIIIIITIMIIMIYCCYHYHYHFYSECCSIFTTHNLDGDLVHPKSWYRKPRGWQGQFGDMVGISLHWVGKKQMP